jgi:GGDEF domain-containing protein
MTHDRPHRGARGPEDACRELIANAGTQFDPEIVQLLVERVRHAPARPADELIDVIVENLPLDCRDIDDEALDALRASTVDSLTLLGDHASLQRAIRQAASDATAERPFAIVLLQLQDLPRINEELGFHAGDRLIRIAGRRALTAATRLGATAYRVSGRRLAIHVRLREGDDLGDVLEDIRSEFMAGPAVDIVASAWNPGDRGEDVVARARRALKGAPA